MTLSFDQQAHAESAAIAAPHQLRLPSGLREELGAHFGADFDDIGLAPTAATPAVTANGADAVTGGDAIAFGETPYQPGSGWGPELIVHELAHVVQQRGGTGGPRDAVEHLVGGPGPGYSIGRPPAVQRVLDDRSPGRPLDAPLREGLRSDFDFSEVRVHADDSAAALAAGVGADAFTRGTDIYFGAGLYQPNSSTGEKLLRHELTHVLQQASGEVSEFAGLVVPPEHPSEARARPHSALGGRALAPGARDSRTQRQAIQRQPSVTGHMETEAPPASRSLTKDWVEKIREALNYDVPGLEPSIEELQAFNRMADVDHDHEITLGELVNALDCTEKITARAWFASAVFFRDYRMDRNLQKLFGEFLTNESARRVRDDARAFEQNENVLRAGPEGNWTNREGREATKRELDRHRDPRRLLPIAAVTAAVIFPEAVGVISAWDTGVKTGETINGERSGVGVWDIMTGNIGVAGTKMTDSERAAAGKDAALGWAAIGLAFVLSRPPTAPSGAPQITFGDVKSINSYEAGLAEPARLEGASSVAVESPTPAPHGALPGTSTPTVELRTTATPDLGTPAASASPGGATTRPMRKLPGGASRGSMSQAAGDPVAHPQSRPTVELRTQRTLDYGKPESSADPLSQAPDPWKAPSQSTKPAAPRAPSGHHQATGQAAKEAQALGLEDVRKGRVGMQEHRSASAVLAATGQVGKGMESTHLVPQAVYQALGLNPDLALTVNFPKAVNTAIDSAWVTKWNKAKWLGQQITGGEVRQWVTEGIRNVPDEMLSSTARNTLEWRFNLELQELGISDDTIIVHRFH